MSDTITLYIDIPLPYKERLFSVAINTFILSQGITALFGPSGAGKTTLLRALTGLPKLNQAYVKFGDIILQDNNTYVSPRKRGFFYVSNEQHLFPHMTVSENWRFAQHHAQKRTGRYRRLELATRQPYLTDLQSLASQFDLTNLLNALPQTLSTGEAQKASLLRAVLTGPDVLLLDEPLGNIDYRKKHQLIEFIRVISEIFSIPMLYISHNPEEVCAIAQRILIIQGGKVTASGPTHELQSQLANTAPTPKSPTSTGAVGILSISPSDLYDFKACYQGHILSITPCGPDSRNQIDISKQHTITVSLNDSIRQTVARNEFLQKYGLTVGSAVYFCEI
jgi:molybdate transport system ATP-binding protein